MQVQLTKEILGLVRDYVYTNGISLSEFARRTGISKAWLSRLKNHDANLSLETATYLLNVIGYKIVIEKKSGSVASVTEKREVLSSRLKKVVECRNE